MCKFVIFLILFFLLFSFTSGIHVKNEDSPIKGIWDLRLNKEWELHKTRIE